MKTHQVASLLVCLLLSSTFAHDYLRVKHFAPLDKHLEGSPSKQISPFQERATSQSEQQCTYVCTETTTSNVSLELIINQTSELIGVVNNTGNVALIVDINAHLVGLFNGSSGAVVVVNYTSQSGIYFASGQTNKGWLSANTSFETYFKTLQSISFFFSLQGGTRFTVQNASNTVLQVIGKLLGHLSLAITLQIQSNIKAALTILIEIGTSISTHLRGDLSGLLRFADADLIRLQGDIMWFINVLEGLATFFGQISGGLSYLIQRGVQFRLAILFAAANGIEMLINLLLAILVRIDLCSILKNSLNNFENFASLIVQLGGGVSSGITGIFKIVTGIMGIINGTIKVDVVFGYLFEYVATRNASGSGEIDISIYYSGFLDVISIQNSTYSNIDALSSFISIVGHLNNGTLTISGINVSKIITSITATAQSGIQLIINVLQTISSVVSLYVSIPALFFYVIQQLSTSAGTLLVQAVFPSIKMNATASSSGGCLGNILHHLNIDDIVRLLLGGINNLLKNLPVIGDIYKAIEVALKTATQGSVNLQSILSSNGAKSLVDSIISFLKSFISGNGLGSSVNVSSSTSASVTSNNGWTWSWGFSFG